MAVCRDIVVVGASLGGVDALPRLVSGLPRDLPAAVLIVQHMAPDRPSFLAQRLAAAGPLPAQVAIDGEPLLEGHIYVAVPDHHLMIEANDIRLSRGPKESHTRPSIDVLFRSAAYAAGPRVIGIVLTGMLDDGTAGLWAIKDHGGIAIVQSPAEAEHPSMPRSALRHVAVDYTLQIADIPNVLRSLTRERVEIKETGMNNNLEIETRIALEDNRLDRGVSELGLPSLYTCPDCHGAMVEIREGSIRRFRCHIGHAYSEQGLAKLTLPKIEQTLSSALSHVEEREALLRELAEGLRSTDPQTAATYEREAAGMGRLMQGLWTLRQDPVFNRSLVQRTEGNQD